MEHKSNCLTTQMNFYQYIGPVGCAMRGRYIDSENGGETIQHMEVRNDKKANAVTTVTKDSMVALPLKVSNQGKKIEVNESGKSVCVVTRGNVGWTNQTMNGVAESVPDHPIEKNQKIYSVKDKTVTITKHNGEQATEYDYEINLPDGDYLVRKFYPIEAERLQTLPDNYTEGISNTQRYKCIGNGWTVDVIAHIMSGLKEAFKDEEE